MSNLRGLLWDPSKTGIAGFANEKLLEMDTFGAEFVNILLQEIKDDFWHDVHCKQYCYKCLPHDIDEFLSENNFFYNRNIFRDRIINCFMVF
jgi:hypothetical protein